MSWRFIWFIFSLGFIASAPSSGGATADLAAANLASSEGADCNDLQAWYRSSNALKLSHGTGLRLVAEAQAAEWHERNQATNAIVSRYFNGAGYKQMDATCLSGQSDRQNFLDTLQAAFIQESLRRLRASRAPALQKFIAMYDRHNGPNSTALIRMFGHMQNESSPTTEKAGFHRGTGSIFLDLSRIPANEWLLILIHELLHNLDPQFYKAIQEYSTPQLVAHLGTLAQEYDDPKYLNIKDQHALQEWIQAGLGRGLWAEYRAWVATFTIYQAGLQEGLWQPTSWADEILSQRADGEKFENFIYMYLDSRSIDPTEGIFSRPLIQRSLQLTRAYYRKSGPPPLGTMDLK
jgi:hypothetical protein